MPAATSRGRSRWTRSSRRPGDWPIRGKRRRLGSVCDRLLELRHGERAEPQVLRRVRLGACPRLPKLRCGECAGDEVLRRVRCFARGRPRAPVAVGAATAEPPAAERRLVSVLFADLVGFTTLSESRDSEDVRELLTRYFETCSRLIGLYGGTVEKFIGDAVMAVWGTPTATEDDAERAVRAALDLVAAVSALGDEVGEPELRARAGVLTGEAAVTIGAEGQGMVAGDLVNTASRVQSVAEPGNGVRRRVDAAGDRADSRLRGSGRVRAEGQGRARRRSGRPCGSSRAHEARSSRRDSRPRSSAAAGSCARSRTSSTPLPTSARRI